VPEVERYCFWITPSSGSATVLHSQNPGGGDAGHLATHIHRLKTLEQTRQAMKQVEKCVIL
jgi:hypothetical protein